MFQMHQQFSTALQHSAQSTTRPAKTPMGAVPVGEPGYVQYGTRYTDHTDEPLNQTVTILVGWSNVALT